MSVFRSVTFCLVLTSLTIASSSRAQVAVQQIQGRQAGQAQPPGTPNADQLRNANNLFEILPALDWEVSERGPLLIVAPAFATKAEGRQGYDDQTRSYRYIPAPTLPPLGRSGLYRLTTIDNFFGRATRQLGTLTAVVPQTMTVLRTDLPAPNPFLLLRREERLRLLQSRLTPDQWRRMSSEQGLSANDLSGDSRDLFLSILPEPFVVSWQQTENQPPQTARLTEAQKANIRISLSAELQWTYESKEKNWMISMGRSYKQSFPSASLITAGDDYREMYQKVGETALKEKKPNRLKPSDIDLSDPRLNVGVSLTDAKTVGDLVKRVADASGMELIADFRYASLPVYVKGDAVRASDLLEALCLSVTGTFRKLSDGKTQAFVLTHDLEGIGAQQAKIAEWANTIRTWRSKLDAEIKQSIAKNAPLSAIRYQPDDPLVPDEKLMKRIAEYSENASKPITYKNNEDWQTANRARQLWVPVEQLPPAALSIVRDNAENWEKNRANQREAPPLRTDAVLLDVRMKTFYLVPGVGKVEAALNFSNNSSLLPQLGNMMMEQPTREAIPNPYPQPKGVISRGVFLSLTTPQEAMQVARLLWSRGLNQLWLDVPTGMTPEALATLVKAAKEAAPGIGVYAVVRPLRLPESEVTAKIADRNILGETRSQWANRVRRYPTPAFDPYSGTALFNREHESQLSGEFVAVDEPGAWEALISPLVAMAKTPGLNGFAVQERQTPRQSQYDQNGALDERYGYTPAHRLAFLRASGVDPIDLLANYYLSTGGDFGAQVNFHPPFLAQSAYFNNGEDTSQKKRLEWGEFLQKTVTSLDKRFYDKLKETLPKEGVTLYCDLSTDWPYRQPYQFLLWTATTNTTPTTKEAGVPVGGPSGVEGKSASTKTMVDQKGTYTVIMRDFSYYYNRTQNSDSPSETVIRSFYQNVKAWNDPKAKVTWRPSGYLFNLSDLSLEEVIKTLERLAPAPL